MKVWAHIAGCLERGAPCALVTVARADGSTPREAGARMVVTEDGGFYGTIGGGSLEFEAIRKASADVRAHEPAFHVRTVSLGPDLGQCCGGRVEIAIEVLTDANLEEARHLASLETAGEAFTTVALVSDNTVQPRRVRQEAATRPFALETDSEGRAQLLVERFGTPLRPVFLFGAGHVGKALVLALAPLPFEIVWIDSRPEQFPGPVPANVRKVASQNPAAELDSAPDGAFVLAMTHSHALDEEIMARALLRQRFSYCGLIGSATKRARFLKRLKSRGLTESLLADMVCPVGVSAVHSKQPAAIAAGIAVELLIRDEAGRQQVTAREGLAQKHTLGQ
ncbi:MAG: xanthine dehydrogenase accessory protein XdhC [Roseibium sp.]